MSCVIVLTPVVIASWPALAGAIVAAAAALGYELQRDRLAAGRTASTSNRASLELDHVSAIAETLGRGESLVARKGDLSVTFACDARGRFTVHVDGARPKAELERIGQELGQAVVQQYVHRRLAEELARQGFTTVEEEQAADRTIHMRVRRYL